MIIARRNFLHKLAGGLGSLILPWKSDSSHTSTSKFTFGVIADPHKDLMPDADQRLDVFMEAVDKRKPDFIIQLGDFCFPKKENKAFLDRWNQYSGPKYHVLGNHDMDVSSKQETMDYWGMPNTHYSFDHSGFHFVVLDANFIHADGKFEDYDHANFYIDSSMRTYVSPQQIEWLEADLKKTQLPTIIFSHQSLFSYMWGVKNRLQIQQVLEKANQEAEFQKVIACLNGHNHIDFHYQLNGIHYLDINSMSYQWLGEKYQNKERFSPELYDTYPHLSKIAPYRESLYAFVTLDPRGKLVLEGVKSDWIAPSPQEAGVPAKIYGMESTPVISDRSISF